jgi:hypothetical protein
LYVKRGDNATTHGKLQQAFGDDAMSTAQVFRWHNRFTKGRTLDEDDERSGRLSATPTGDNTPQVREFARSDQR